MTPNMKEFLTGLADLMDKHSVEHIRAVEETHNWQTSVAGVEIYILGKWNLVEGKYNPEFEEYLLPVYMWPEDVRNAV